ncbi:LOW QUALITY PROTEIN: hypothetical protein CRUP_036040, partial [Coryphaenoides rupestris]
MDLSTVATGYPRKILDDMEGFLVSKYAFKREELKAERERPQGGSKRDCSFAELDKASYRSDEEMVKFMHLMNSIWNICGRDVVTAFDLSPFRSVYDLGVVFPMFLMSGRGTYTRSHLSDFGNLSPNLRVCPHALPLLAVVGWMGALRRCKPDTNRL